MKTSFWAIPLLIFWCSVSQAAQDRFVANDATSFDVAASSLRAELSSNRYPLLSSEDKQSIEMDLNQMQAVLKQYGPPASLNKRNGVRYFNAEEHLNGLLTGDLAQRHHCVIYSVDPVIRCSKYGQGSGESVADVRTVQPPVGGPAPFQIQPFGSSRH